MNSAQKTFQLVRLCTRRYAQASIRNQSTSVTEVPSSKFAGLKEKQKVLQIREDIPVHLARGFGDRLLFGITLVLTAICTGMSAEVLISQSYPPKQD